MEEDDHVPKWIQITGNNCSLHTLLYRYTMPMEGGGGIVWHEGPSEIQALLEGA